jgi:hypothetical protein
VSTEKTFASLSVTWANRSVSSSFSLNILRIVHRSSG